MPVIVLTRAHPSPLHFFSLAPQSERTVPTSQINGTSQVKGLSQPPAIAQRLMYEIGTTGSSIQNSDVELNVFVSDIHFRIDLLTTNFESNPGLLKEYLLHVERSNPKYIPPLPDDPNTKFVDPLEEFYEWATKPFLPLFREIHPLDRK